MAVIASFRDLNVYNKAGRAAKKVYQMTLTLPADERYSLSDQIRRSSRAVCALLAEAWGRRRYPLAFANKVDEAMGEAMETQAWLDHALSCKYISMAEYRELDAEWQEIGAMLRGIIDHAPSFCPRPAKGK